MRIAKFLMSHFDASPDIKKDLVNMSFLVSISFYLHKSRLYEGIVLKYGHAYFEITTFPH